MPARGDKVSSALIDMLCFWSCCWPVCLLILFVFLIGKWSSYMCSAQYETLVSLNTLTEASSIRWWAIAYFLSCPRSDAGWSLVHCFSTAIHIPEWHKEEKERRAAMEPSSSSSYLKQERYVTFPPSVSIEMSIVTNKIAKWREEARWKTDFFVSWSKQILGIRPVLWNRLIISIWVQDGKICFINISIRSTSDVTDSARSRKLSSRNEMSASHLLMRNIWILDSRKIVVNVNIRTDECYDCSDC